MAFQTSCGVTYNTPTHGEKATMSGFLEDYIINFRRLRAGAEPKPEEAAHIMWTASSKWPHQDGQGYVP